MVNITAIDNITPLELNITEYSKENIVSTLFNSAYTETDGWWGLIVLLALFIFLIIELYKNSGDFRLDILKSAMFSSLACVVIGMLIIMISVPFNVMLISFRVLGWFVLIYLVSLIGSYYLKKKGL